MKLTLELLAINKEDRTKLRAILIPAILLWIAGVVDGLINANLLMIVFASCVALSALIVRADIIRRFRL